jgi:hypothetical protein
MAGKHSVSFSVCCVARRYALVLNQGWQTHPTLWLPDAKPCYAKPLLTCLSYAGCACLSDGRAAILITCSVPPDLGPIRLETFRLGEAREANSIPGRPLHSTHAT